MTEVASLLRAAAHPDRLRILQVVLESRKSGQQALSVTEIARRSELNRFSVSHHLGLLTEARLVHCTVEGRRRMHSLSTAAFEVIEDWVIAFTLLVDA